MSMTKHLNNVDKRNLYYFELKIDAICFRYHVTFYRADYWILIILCYKCQQKIKK